MNQFSNNYKAIKSEQAIAEAKQSFLTKVYAWMVGGLLLTGVTSYYVFNSGMWITIAQNQMLFYGLIIAELAMVWTLSAKVASFSKAVSAGLFLGYSLLNGLTLSVIFAAYTMESIQQVFFISAGMFGAISLYGYFTKRDLTGLGSFMFMGLIGIILASVVNIFLASSAIGFAVSVIGVIVFAGLTAYDTQKLKEMYEVEFAGEGLAGKAAIAGALSLYLDFINLFLMLLRLFGSRR